MIFLHHDKSHSFSEIDKGVKIIIIIIIIIVVIFLNFFPGEQHPRSKYYNI